MDALAILDLMMRGGAAGVSFILAAALLRRAARSSIARFGALFAFGAACYAAASAQPVAEAAPGLVMLLKPFAISTGVFFWWFALAMFCDLNRWHWSRLIPFALVFVCAVLVPIEAAQGWVRAAHIFTEGVTAALMLHVIAIIVTGANDDLVERRRKVRTVWVGAISLTVLAVVVGETWSLFLTPPTWLVTLEAALLLVVTSGATLWSLSAQPDFFPSDRKPALEPAERGSSIAAADRHLASTLQTAMRNEAWREPGLTVGALAERLGTPEHRLRMVINQQLGYRNFAAFLNEHRIEAARTALSDPVQSSKQILQIALDLGYGSIAPFNRAFRSAVGVTPTEYRRAALEGDFQSSPAAAE